MKSLLDQAFPFLSESKTEFDELCKDADKLIMKYKPQMEATLKYCDKRMSNTSKCSNIAVVKVEYINPKGYETPSDKRYGCRCKEHSTTATSTYKVKVIEELEQVKTVQKINDHLMSSIGKEIFSKFHREALTVKYLKENCAVMCQNKYGKWRLVYYHQIEQ